MIDFEEMLFNVPYEWSDTDYNAQEGNLERPMKGKKLYFKDLCQQYNSTDDDEDPLEQVGPTPPVKIPPKCKSTQKPHDFVYEKYNDTYNLTSYSDDKALLEKV